MTHAYLSHIRWTGNRGQGTASYRGYDRTWNIEIEGKASISCSNDPLLGGDPSKMNPEDLLLSALSACHMLWYLHYAAVAGIAVHSYADTPIGQAEVGSDGAGQFVQVVLRPTIALSPGSDVALAASLHDRIHQVCFIARSVNFPVDCQPIFTC